MQRVRLGNTGLTVSRLAFGTVYLGPLSDCLSPEDGARLLLHAHDRGITFWDTSDDYGSHVHVACALRHVRREHVILASKASNAEGAVERILGELGTS